MSTRLSCHLVPFRDSGLACTTHLICVALKYTCVYCLVESSILHLLPRLLTGRSHSKDDSAVILGKYSSTGKQVRPSVQKAKGSLPLHCVRFRLNVSLSVSWTCQSGGPGQRGEEGRRSRRQGWPGTWRPLAPLQVEEGSKYLTVGTLGHPNVGKSSLINSLLGKKLVSSLQDIYHPCRTSS